MYSRQEASQLKQEFWTAFGQYMRPVLSAEGERINWINYKTGEKNIYFRMHADNREASIAIEITHRDQDVQALYFEQFEQLKTLLYGALQEEWNWLLYIRNEHGKCISRIYTETGNVNILDKNDWPQLISFFKPRIVALDEFWSTAKHVFEGMR
jgi:hypothetical protein